MSGSSFQEGIGCDGSDYKCHSSEGKSAESFIEKEQAKEEGENGTDVFEGHDDTGLSPVQSKGHCHLSDYAQKTNCQC